ncbi:glycoside hydrolase [Thermosulfuriphilus ammonigenes]|uniref:Glycoside hydrolase n=1 Tax=Thermosulfuriphilus ammonigenes TaxID=1936021 RepID=A0A6G7PXG9_9BACT|nr:glycoside hydrolase family 57 protein [Thermosulfuriphilus ammonigenes]MBA2847689.1 alpha-amylase/alpha-mannosidase (GH57 family) [Thermosulfuriphilus ammonigenes]QIJ72103.1 glycoside hydrolase [Thermosulfuriphilus ammonigenes]
MGDEPLYVAFIWHMHQPFYYDWRRDSLSLPWVRLHATKAYTDMPALLEEYPRVRAIFNLVPSLLKQIKFYESGGDDEFLTLSRKPASELNQRDREFILVNFFSCHWETMVNPYPRYRALLEKRGLSTDQASIRAAVSNFSDQDFLDLQVWFNLTWIGFYLRGDPLIRHLLAKERTYSEEDKNQLLDFQIKVLKEVIPRYRRLLESGQIEISTSPFYHPILPLLIDSDCARRSMPQVALPPRFSFPEDAQAQIKQALDYHEAIFGRRPQGLWPSEGSVSPELVPILEDCGLIWAATDEEILFHSLPDPSPAALFQPYLVNINGARVNMVFRHHGLSDRIGFVYQRNPASQSVEDFIEELRRIRAFCFSHGSGPWLVSIILDGENPWEYYPDGGEAFLRGLYEALSEAKDLETVTLVDFLTSHSPRVSLENLFTGSWINHNFDIWIGGEEENKAWTLLGQTRRWFKEREKELSSAERQAAYEAIMAAEGSDWFWWFGDHFSSNYDAEFDRLFRGHLVRVYESCGHHPPAELSLSIRRLRRVEPQRTPVGFISPVIDGKVSHFLEWSGSGYYSLSDFGSAMYLGPGLIEAVYFGFNLKEIFFRLDPQEPLNNWPEDIEINIILSGRHKAVLSFKPRAENIIDTYRIRLDDRVISARQEGGKLAVAKIIELSIPFSVLNFRVGENVIFWIEILEKGLVRERVPRMSYLSFTVPDENFEQIFWQV